jgi:hypothetical protein
VSSFCKSVTSWLTAANASGELSLSHWEIDAIFPSMREMRESLELWELPGGLPDGGAVLRRVARGVPPSGLPRRFARVHRGFIDLTRPGEGFEIMYHFI